MPQSGNPTSRPSVSIVVPTYNRARLVLKTLRSCLEQTYRNLELIVVDDGSTDGTADVVTALEREEPRIRYLRQSNQKLPAALNAGFRISRGEYLTWTADDNQYHRDAIEVMARALSENPDVGFVYSDYDLVDHEGRALRRFSCGAPEHLQESNCVGACFMYRRRVYEEVGDYDPDWVYIEDYEYWFRVRQHFKMMPIFGVNLMSFARHAESLTALLGLRQALLALCVRLEHRRAWGRKVDLLIASKMGRALELAGIGTWRRPFIAALVYALAKPWSPYRWGILRDVLREAGHDRAKLGSAAAPLPSS